MENPRPFLQKIRAGSQIEINGSQDEVDYIIKQHQIYGLVEAKHIKGHFSGLAYSIGKPISVNNIEEGISKRDEELIDRALEARKIQAASADKIISEKAQEMGLRQSSGIEVDIVEEKKNAADNTPKFEQTIEVVKEGITPKAGRKSR